MLIAYFNSLYTCLFIIGVAALFICIYIDLSKAEVCWPKTFRYMSKYGGKMIDATNM